MKAAALLLLALTLSACTGTGGPALRHVAEYDEHPDFRDCVTMVQASADMDATGRAERLNTCLSRPQVAQTGL